MASLEFCRACRNTPTLHVRVDYDTPRTLWSPGSTTRATPSEAEGSKVRVSRRVPVVRALYLTWELPLKALAEPAATELWTWSEYLRLGEHVPAGSVESVVWPRGLKHLVLDAGIETGGINTVRWPGSLQTFDIGTLFDQPIIGVVWPASLRRLSLGQSFNQPIAGVVWPASLQCVDFGDAFDTPIAGAVPAKAVVWVCF